jgi:hypothetical protein
MPRSCKPPRSLSETGPRHLSILAQRPYQLNSSGFACHDKNDFPPCISDQGPEQQAVRDLLHRPDHDVMELRQWPSRRPSQRSHRSCPLLQLLPEQGRLSHHSQQDRRSLFPRSWGKWKQDHVALKHLSGLTVLRSCLLSLSYFPFSPLFLSLSLTPLP